MIYTLRKMFNLVRMQKVFDFIVEMCYNKEDLKDFKDLFDTMSEICEKRMKNTK